MPIINILNDLLKSDIFKTKQFVQELDANKGECTLERADDYFITRLSDIHFQVKNMCNKSNVLDYELVIFNNKVSLFF